MSLCKGERWVHGDLRHYSRSPHTEKWAICDPATGLETDIDETTIGQLTGVCDSFGKPIYEGDILKSINGGTEGIVTYYPEHGGFRLRVSDRMGHTTAETFNKYSAKYSIITGNIHEKGIQEAQG